MNWKSIKRYWICLLKHNKKDREFIGDEYKTKRCTICGKFWYKFF